MSRGPRSERAIEAAAPVARMRGEVMYLEQRPGTCFHFFISGPGGTCAVCAGRAQRIHGSPAEITADHEGTIARIRAAVLAPGISRELWLWSQWGTMRYFRVEGTGLTELDRLGVVRAPLVKGPPAGTMRPRWKRRRKKTVSLQQVPETGTIAEKNGDGNPAAGPGPGKSGNAASGSQKNIPGTAGGLNNAGIPPPAEPAPARYLRHRNRELLKAKSGRAGPDKDPDLPPVKDTPSPV